MNKQPPDGYRLLGVGEVVSAGDIYCDHNGWGEVSTSIGAIVSADDYILYAREIAPPAITFVSGAKRSDATGRGRFDLIPYEAMLCLARRYEMGVPLYGERNWEAGQPLSRILSSLRRHAMQINYDFSEDHIGAVLWNAAAFVTIVERVRAGILPKELDDLGFLSK